MNSNENINTNKEVSIEEKRLNLIMKHKELNAEIEMLLSADYIFDNDTERFKLDKKYFALAKERDLVEQAILSIDIK